MRIERILFSALLCFIGILAPPVSAAGSAIHFQAHRGGLHEVPENTLAAFYYAWNLGGIPEVDIRTTADGVILCLHDATLKRTTDATDQADVPVDELTLAEVQRYDAGGCIDARYAGERVPTLVQVLEVLQRHPDYQIYLDLKAVDLGNLAALIDSYGVAPQIIFCHNQVSSCQALKESIPSLRTMLWIGGDADAIWGKFETTAHGGFVHLNQVQLHLQPAASEDWPFAISKSRLSEALRITRGAGIDLEVLPFQFTCESLSALVDLGIEWYATDEPQRFRQCLGKDSSSAAFLRNGVTAHRGDSGNYPENTIVAIDSAISLGADWIEIDIFKTADDKIVVTHDATTERFGDKTLVVAESTLDALRSIDVAAGFRKASGSDAKHCPPEVIAAIKAADIEVGAWTINDVKTMQHLLNMGVERMYTDFPRRLLALKRE